MITSAPVAIFALTGQYGLRFVTIFSTIGIINVEKMLSVVGSVIGSGVNYVCTKMIAQNATNIFLNNKLD